MLLEQVAALSNNTAPMKSWCSQAGGNALGEGGRYTIHKGLRHILATIKAKILLEWTEESSAPFLKRVSEDDNLRGLRYSATLMAARLTSNENKRPSVETTPSQHAFRRPLCCMSTQLL